MFDVPPPPTGNVLNATQAGTGAPSGVALVPSHGGVPAVASLRQRGVLAAAVCVGIGGAVGFWLSRTFAKTATKKKG